MKNLTEPITLIGSNASPYSRKMRALLRYRHIPFRWALRGSPAAQHPPVPVGLIPIVVFPANADRAQEAAIDSTPIIRRLEREHAERTVLPPDPAQAFLCSLLEDYADEWMTKAMFHYRWSFEPDIAKSKYLLPLDTNHSLPQAVLQSVADNIAERQIGRLAVVGSNATTAPVIEESYRRTLCVLAEMLERRPYLFGDRPSAADFAWYGQLSQLVWWDPTSTEIAERIAPRVIAWVMHMEDEASLEPTDAGWSPSDRTREVLHAVLAEVGRLYVPFMLANAEAIERSAASLECELDGRPFTQKPFPYQAKCLRALRAEFAALSVTDRAWLGTLLTETGCAALVR